MWKPGDNVALRGIVNDRVWLAQSVTVVKDSTEETALLLTPGAECAYPEGYWRWKRGDFSQGTRWTDSNSNAWTFREFAWQKNRVLILLEPEKYYSVSYYWYPDSSELNCYYIDFLLPFSRSHFGFDTFDLELDIVVDPLFTWSWKDEDGYHTGIREGCITESWAAEVTRAKAEVLAKINERRYPMDSSWLNWKPDAQWLTPRLPDRWKEA